jgi:hypothetical protein
MLKSNLRFHGKVRIRFGSILDARCSRVLYERKHDGAGGVGTEKGDAFREAITIYIGLRRDKRHSVNI